MEKIDLSHAVKAAQSLLGWELVRESKEGVTSGYIIETEAYHQDEASSHSHRGKTERNKAMFGPAGNAYVYFTYGMHYCFNVVTGPEGSGQGVLIRALKPVQGVELMQKRRGNVKQYNLANGPAKLVQAMGISKDDYGRDLFERRELYLQPGVKPGKILRSPRIGIKQATDLHWRFYTADPDSL